MVKSDCFRRLTAIVLSLLIAAPLFSLASFAADEPAFTELNVYTDTLQEGDVWYNCRALADATGTEVYRYDSTFYLSEDQNTIRIEYTADETPVVELRGKETDPQYFDYLRVMPAFGEALPTSADGLAAGDYWFDKNGLVAALEPYMPSSYLSYYSDGTYYLSVDGTILRRTYILYGYASNSDELVVEAPGTMSAYLRQVGNDPNAGFVLLAKTADGLSEGEYWFDAAGYAEKYGGAYATYYLNADYYLSEDGNTLRMVMLGNSTDLTREEASFIFAYVHQIGSNPNAGFTRLPTSDTGLADGAYWFDAAGFAQTVGDANYLNAEYYLSDDGNTLRLIYLGYTINIPKSEEYGAAYFAYLHQVGVDPNEGFTLLPKSEEGLEDGAYWYDAAGLAQLVERDAYLDADYYLSDDGATLRVIVSGRSQDIGVTSETGALYFNFLRQAGVDPLEGCLPVAFAEDKVLCIGYWFRMDEYIDDQIEQDNMDRVAQGKEPYTDEEEADARAKLRDEISALSMYLDPEGFRVLLVVGGYSLIYSQGDKDYDEIVSYISYVSDSHIWNGGEETTAPTCTEDGVMTFTCTRCSETKTDTIDALGHSFEDAEWTSADETQHQRACVRCGEAYDYADHAYDMQVKAPTCTEDGVITYVCKDCGYTFDAAGDQANGHRFGAWNYKDEDVHERVCTVCGEGVETQAHNYAEDPDRLTAATCTEEGTRTFVCADCGSIRTQPIDALGHAWNDGEVTTAPSCTADGVRTYTCTREGSHTYTESVPATGHSFGAWTQTKAPTEYDEGEETRVCSACGTKETRGISLLPATELTIVKKPDVPLTYKTSFTLEASEAVIWSSSDEKVVKVDPTTGKLTTVGKGTATITATSVRGEKTASCSVSVQYAWWQMLIRILLLGFLWY